MHTPVAEAQTTAPHEHPPRLAYKWLVLISVVFGVFMVILDSTVVNVALRTLQEAFAATTAQVQWVVSAYMLALGIATPLAGYLATRFGSKRIYLAGLGLFVLGSVLSGLAPSLMPLVLARVLQGIGGGMTIPVGTAMLFAAFPPKERGVALGIFGIALVVAPTVGPILGGALSDAGLWRWIFFLNMPVGLLGIVFSGRLLRRDAVHQAPPLDMPGVVLSTVGFGAILYAATLAGDRSAGLFAPATLASGAIGLAALVLFGFVEIRTTDPLLDLRLFGLRSFAVSNLVGWVTTVALFGSSFLMPLYLQVVRETSALQAGLTLLPQAIATAIVMPVAGRLYDRFGARWLVAGGFVLLAVDTWALAKLDLTTPMPYIMLLMALRGIAFGMTSQITQVSALRDVVVDKLPIGTSIINATRLVFQALGVAVLASVLAGAIQAPPEQTELFRLEYLTGLERAYLVTFVASLVALALSLFLPDSPESVHAVKARPAGEQPQPAT